MDALSLLVGAAIPVLTLFINSLEKEKYFKLEIKEKLKLVAVEKRLEAHQKAFTLWYELQDAIFPRGGIDKRSDVVTEAEKFWKENALFLEKNTRKVFRQALNIVLTYTDELDEYRQEKDPVEKAKAKKAYLESWNLFQSVHGTIQQEVMLEPLRPDIEVNAEGEEVKNK